MATYRQSGLFRFVGHLDRTRVIVAQALSLFEIAANVDPVADAKVTSEGLRQSLIQTGLPGHGPLQID
jgi:hypothetical protein